MAARRLQRRPRRLLPDRARRRLAASGWCRSASGPSSCASRMPPPERDPPRDRPKASRCARRHGCQLIVNDYWREALSLGADYIHLGQEDLAAADVPTIQAKGVRLGISTHSEEELAIALAAAPSYVALGPIYETRLKAMKWAPQGLDRIGRLEEAHRRPAAGRHRRHHARAGRRRAGGRRRQPRRDHRFLHPCRSGGPRAPVAGLGGALQGLNARGRQGRYRVHRRFLRWIVTVANV